MDTSGSSIAFPTRISLNFFLVCILTGFILKLLVPEQCILDDAEWMLIANTPLQPIKRLVYISMVLLLSELSDIYKLARLQLSEPTACILYSDVGNMQVETQPCCMLRKWCPLCLVEEEGRDIIEPQNTIRCIWSTMVVLLLMRLVNTGRSSLVVTKDIHYYDTVYSLYS